MSNGCGDSYVHWRFKSLLCFVDAIYITFEVRREHKSTWDVPPSSWTFRVHLGFKPVVLGSSMGLEATLWAVELGDETAIVATQSHPTTNPIHSPTKALGVPWEFPWTHRNTMGSFESYGPWDSRGAAHGDPHLPMGFAWAHGVPMGSWESYGPMGISWAHGRFMGQWSYHFIYICV